MSELVKKSGLWVLANVVMYKTVITNYSYSYFFNLPKT
jgi:hypothetical protein